MLPVALVSDPDRARMLRKRYGANMAPEARERDLAIGSAEHIRGMVERYRAVGVEGIILAYVPMNPRLFHQLHDEVLAAFV